MRPVLNAALVCAALLVFCIMFVDRPVTSWVMHNVFTHPHLPDEISVLAGPSLLSLPAALLVFAYYGLRRSAGTPTGEWVTLLLMMSVATAIATVGKDELKWLIGRPWPSTWVRNGIFYLSPFRADIYFGSFPSGHTSYIAAPMFVLWWRMPQYRVLWMGTVVLAMIGLVFSAHHWVSDVVGGFFLGMAAGTGVVKCWPGGVRAPMRAHWL